MFVNGEIEALIDTILSKSRVPPIIILQGDTGLDFSLGTTAYNILNAYFFPDGNYGLLYESITPVNSFRVVLNTYFGTDYKLLEDVSYATSYRRPFQFSIMAAGGGQRK